MADLPARRAAVAAAEPPPPARSSGKPPARRARRARRRARAGRPQATRESILRAATKVFAKHGFAGGRVEQISKAAKSYDRMIYYYFGSKEGLFVAVLEEMYRRFNEAEAKLALDADAAGRVADGGDPLHVALLPPHPEFITPAEHREPAPRQAHRASRCARASTRRRRSSVLGARAAHAASSRACSAPTSRRATST